MNNIYTTRQLSILIIGISEWQGKYASIPNAYAKELSKYTDVYYVDRPYTLKDFFTRISTRKVKRIFLSYFFWKYRIVRPIEDLPQLHLISSGFIIPVNFLPPGKLYDLLQKANERITYIRLEKVFKKCNVKNFIFLNSYNPFIGNYFPASFKPLLTIYHCWDDIRYSEYIFKHGPSLEIAFMKKSDVVLASSHRLMELCKQYHSTVYLSQNAADTKLFKQEFAVKTISNAAIFNKERRYKGVIGYIGNIDNRINYHLVLQIAKGLPEYLLVMVGPESISDELFEQTKKCSNVTTTGSVLHEYLPAYLHQFDCTIIPFRYNELTKSIYPLKINEYLAAGKPVVSTCFSSDIESFKSVIYLVDAPEAFNDAIKQSIADDCESLQDRRMQFSENNTWPKRISQFNEIVSRHLTVKDNIVSQE
ncbi:MAG: glycosyltransferase [Cyclobacteriaceae bacterium]|nr:glycosyltransferase [Cyclobacteriaceae bacterium]